MRLFSIVAAILLVSMAYAETYTQEYLIDGWLAVSRTVDVGDYSICAMNGVSNVCANTGGLQVGTNQSSLNSLVTLSARNIGPIDRSGVELSESLSFVPDGASISFFPNATSYYADQATWVLGKLAKNGQKNVSYSISAGLTGGMVSRIPDIGVKSDKVSAILLVSSSATEGDRKVATLQTVDGKPLYGTIINVVYPNGKSTQVKTDMDGKASFFLPYTGKYTYFVDGYSLLSQPATLAGKKAVALPAAAAAVADSGITGEIIKIIPTFAAIFAILAVILIIFGFFRSRKEEEYYAAPSEGSAPVSPDSGAYYTQRFSFASEPDADRKLEEKTRDIIGSRKRQMHAADMAVEEAREKEGEEQEEQYSEKTEIKAFTPEAKEIEEEKAEEEAESSEESEEYDDVEAQLAKLEEKAREGGDSTEEGRDMDAIIAELEEIRNKLREGRASEETEDYSDSEKGEATVEDSPDEAGPDDSGSEWGGEKESIIAEKPREEESDSEEWRGEEKESSARKKPVKAKTRPKIKKKSKAPAKKQKR